MMISQQLNDFSRSAAAAAAVAAAVAEAAGTIVSSELVATHLLQRELCSLAGCREERAG